MNAGGQVEVEELTDVIGANVLRLRRALGWSQDHLATAAGLSKGTVVAIEQQRSNPSVATLCALSETLGVGLSTLLERQAQVVVKHRRARDAVALWSTEAGSRAELLIGTDPPGAVELWRWELAEGDAFDGEAHPRGTTEVLQVERGRVSLTTDGRVHAVEEGDVLVFEAHHPHTYANAGEGVARFSMWIVIGDEGPMPPPFHQADGPP